MGLFDGFTKALNDVWDATVNTVSNVAGSAGDAVKGGWDAVVDRVQNAPTTTSPFQSLQNVITGNTGNAAAATEAVKGGWDATTKTVAAATDTVVEAVPVAIDTVVNTVSSVPQFVAGIPANVIKATTSIGGDISAGIKKYAPYALAGAGVILALKFLK